MEYIKLGKSDLSVSRLCAGCMGFGDTKTNFHAWTLDAEQSETLVRRALDLGINFFDTANIYSAGTSEEYLGRAIRNNIARNRVILASKVYYNDGHLSKQAILREIDGSLRHLGTDYLDLYIIHRFDYVTPVEETMEALHGLVKAGKVRALGASAMYGYQFSSLQLAAKDNGWTPFVSMQNHLNLLYREEEREMVPFCQDQKIALTPYSPLAAGRLTRDWQGETKRALTDQTAKMKYDQTLDQDRIIVERVAEVAESLGVKRAQVALAWLRQKEVCTVPIIGATKESHLLDAIPALDLKLTPDQIAYLEEMYLPHRVVGAR